MEPRSLEVLNDQSKEKQGEEKAITDIYITRHAPRLAGENTITNEAGEQVTITDPKTLSERGKKIAEGTGIDLQQERYDLIKSYSSMEPRAKETGDIMTEASSVVSQQTGRSAITRKRPHLEYSILSSDAEAKAFLKKAPGIIQKNLPPNFAELSQEDRAETREKLQPTGMKIVLENEKAVNILAEAEAFRLDHLIKLALRGTQVGTKVAIPLIGHGLFFEALAKKALVREKQGNKKIGYNDVEEIGGFLKPGESLRTRIICSQKEMTERVIKDGKEEIHRTPVNIEKIEFLFTDSEREKLFEGTKYYLDMNIVQQLADNFRIKLMEK